MLATETFTPPVENVMTRRQGKQSSFVPVPFDRKIYPSGRHGKHTRGPVSVPTLGERLPPEHRRKSERVDTSIFVGVKPDAVIDFVQSQGFDVAQALAEGFNVLSERRALADSDPDPLNRAVREMHLAQSTATRAKQFAGGLGRLFGAADEDVAELVKQFVERSQRREEAAKK